MAAASHVALAVHPDSGRGGAARVAGQVAQQLRGATDRLELLAANTVAQSHELMARARIDGLTALVVLGGDGALHQAVQFCAETEIALGVIPSGTGNDLARALGVPETPMRAANAVVQALRNDLTRRIDLGRVGDTWFSTVLCSGFDACVNARANRMRWPAGPRRYDIAIVRELATFRTKPLVVRTAQAKHELEATLVAVGNTSSYGGGVPICPDARPDDGLFDVTVVGHAGRGELIRMLPGLRKGRHIDHPAVRTFRARSVGLDGTKWPAYADGEAVGVLPMTADCLPGALRVLDHDSFRAEPSRAARSPDA